LTVTSWQTFTVFKWSQNLFQVREKPSKADAVAVAKKRSRFKKVR
jgi:hypothetical protein